MAKTETRPSRLRVFRGGSLGGPLARHPVGALAPFTKRSSSFLATPSSGSSLGRMFALRSVALQASHETRVTGCAQLFARSTLQKSARPWPRKSFSACRVLQAVSSGMQACVLGWVESLLSQLEGSRPVAALGVEAEWLGQHVDTQACSNVGADEDCIAKGGLSCMLGRALAV